MNCYLIHRRPTLYPVNIDFDYFSRHSAGCVFLMFHIGVSTKGLDLLPQGRNGYAVLLGFERMTHAVLGARHLVERDTFPTLRSAGVHYLTTNDGETRMGEGF
jgi:hypothetical protein